MHTSHSEGKIDGPSGGKLCKGKTSEKTPFLSEYTFLAESMSVSCFTLACARSFD